MGVRCEAFTNQVSQVFRIAAVVRHEEVVVDGRQPHLEWLLFEAQHEHHATQSEHVYLWSDFEVGVEVKLLGCSINGRSVFFDVLLYSQPVVLIDLRDDLQQFGGYLFSDAAEVAQFVLPSLVDKDVLELYVTMAISVAVHSFQRRSDCVENS